jgi:hypothetical protein
MQPGQAQGHFNNSNTGTIPSDTIAVAQNTSSADIPLPTGLSTASRSHHKRPRTHHPAGAIPRDTLHSQPDASHGTYSNDVLSTPNTSLAESQPCPDLNTIPLEGHESMMWYDQLFASSFSAIDNPFLVNAEFDASVDPNWNYLR